MKPENQIPSLPLPKRQNEEMEENTGEEAPIGSGFLQDVVELVVTHFFLQKRVGAAACLGAGVRTTMRASRASSPS